MASTRINFVRATSYTFEISIVDEDGQPTPLADLAGASAEFFLRSSATSNIDILHFTTADPTHLVFSETEPVLTLYFLSEDTEALDLGTYAYRVIGVLADGRAPDIIEWSPFDLNLGGIAEDEPPAFDNTTAVDHDYSLLNNLRYMTPGGTPIAAAQIRLYLKSDYDARIFTSPVGTTTTDADGKWTDPILVTPGYSYVVQFLKPNEFGPDIATIVA